MQYKLVVFLREDLSRKLAFCIQEPEINIPIFLFKAEHLVYFWDIV